MSGVHCERCQTTVLLEQDGRSCSNCGATLIGPVPLTQPTPPTPKPDNLRADPPRPEATSAKKRGARTRKLPARSAA